MLNQFFKKKLFKLTSCSDKPENTNDLLMSTRLDNIPKTGAAKRLARLPNWIVFNNVLKLKFPKISTFWAFRALVPLETFKARLVSDKGFVKNEAIL